MKKAIILIIALLVLVCSSGCGNTTSAVSASSVANTQENAQVSKMPDNSMPNSEGKNQSADKVKYTVTNIEEGKLTVKDETGNISDLDIDENVEYRLYRPDMDRPEGTEGEGNPPQMQNGEMPGRPDGTEGEGNPPQMQNGEMPNKPDGGKGKGNPPQMQNGEMPDKPNGDADGNNPPQMQGNPPEKPEGTPGNDNMQMPDGMESLSFESISVGDVIYVVKDDSGKVTEIEIEMSFPGEPQSDT